ncbi:MAG: DUF4270 domain-containing protein [Bacteroidales bacterium]|nr:DUF4270 domain-containing protein [Bacteroidales bacterium]MCF8337445.1 DUF4270 domain-containing protein [Bacteroidales bacterium]
MNRFVIKALFVVGIVSLIVGCEEEPSDIGLGVQPDDNELEIESMDTITVNAHSTRLDSLRTDESEYNLLGSYYDPVFGISRAEFYTSFALTETNPDFDNNPEVDSLVLSLAYKKHYGDTVTPQNLEVYELSESIIDTVYSHETFDHESVELSDNYSFSPKPNTSVMVDTSLKAPHIRINLDGSLAEKLLNATNDEMEDDESFKEFFKGLYVKANPVSAPGSGSISYIDMTSSLSKLTLYYHNDSDTSSYEYQVFANTPRANYFDHNNYEEASVPFKKQVINGHTSLGNQRVYLQAMAGVQTTIRLPHLQDLKGKIAINNAFLQLPLENDPMFDPPDPLNLLLQTTDNDTTGVELLPDNSEGAAYFGGEKKDGRYQFRISRYLQRVIQGSEESKTLLLTIPNSMNKANRAILKGPKASGDRMKLKILYTKVE